MFTAGASARARQYSRAQVLAFCCILAFLAAASLLATVVHAAPAAPAAGGTLTVNGSADNVISDTVLTLREALLIARGGTGGDGVTTGLGRKLSLAERAQTAGCTFASLSDNTITGGCGGNQPDTIQFANLLFNNTITLASSLPPIADSQPTTLDGSGTFNLYIDAAGIPAAHDALLIVSDNNTVTNLTIANSKRFNLYVSGGSNLLQSVKILSAGSHGIYLRGDSNTLISSTVELNGGNGIDIDSAFGVLRANIVLSNTGNGLRLFGAAHDNYIGCSVLCIAGVNGNLFANNFAYGIALTGTLVTHNFIEANLVGLNAAATAKNPNVGGGVLLFGAHDNTIGDAGLRANNISGNNGPGITLDYFAYANSISGNTIGFGLVGNMGDGVLIQGGAQYNTIGASGAGLGNLIARDGFVGVGITGAHTAYNVVDNNIITGTLSAGVWIESSAHDNIIGSDVNSRNSIGQSAGDGVHMESSAYSNTVGYNYIGTDASFNNWSNAGYGVLLSNAFDNRIGPEINDAPHNYIYYNGEGVRITGVGSYGNHVALNWISSSIGNGMVLANGAHGNTLGSALGTSYVQFNHANGVALQAGAHDNTLVKLNASDNQKNGIELTDAGTDSNLITTVSTYTNLLDGINERSGAQDNAWSQLSSYGNGGLGIDKNAPSDTTNIPDGPFASIRSASMSGITVTISGVATPYSADPSVTIELYQVYGPSMDPSGYGEGYIYLGTAAVDGSGHWTMSLPLGGVSCYTAVQTVHALGNFTNTSSEFGPNSCRLFLPIIKR